MSARHVIVTGAAGFIGAQLSQRMRAEGYRVIGIDGLYGTGTETVDTAAQRLAGLADDPGFDLLECDVRHRKAAGSMVGACAVFHLAGRPGAREIERQPLVEHNIAATAAVVAAAEAAAVPDLLFASSSAVYGAAGARGRCSEEAAIRPISIYGQTKRTGELLCLRSSQRAMIVRFFTVYGPGQRSDMAFSRFIAAALDGSRAPRYQGLHTAREYTYVADAVEGLLLAWRYGRRSIYNVSGGSSVRLRSVIDLIEEITGRKVPLEEVCGPPEPTVTRADLTAARSDLGYRPRVALRAGLEEQIAEAISARTGVL
jgi:UDP-glucuronate 4-epimerase